MIRRPLLFTMALCLGQLSAQQPVEELGPPDELAPLESALTYHTPDYHLDLRRKLLRAAPEHCLLQFLREPSFAPETLLAIHPDGDGFAATVIQPQQQIWGNHDKLDSIPCRTSKKALPEAFAKRLEVLWQAMLRRTRYATKQHLESDGKSFVFLQRGSNDDEAAVASNPAPGSRLDALAQVGDSTVAFVFADASKDAAGLQLLDDAMTALERMLANPEAPPPSKSTKQPTDLRPQFAAFDLPPRAQGPRPTCSIFTTTAAIEFAVARVTGHGERLSVDYCNWAANAATNRHDDGDFFHNALAGFAKFGICHDALLPYAKTFRGDELPSPEALVDGGRMLALADTLRIRWIRQIAPQPGLTDAEFQDILQTLANGWPVAAGSGHSRLLVGYREDPKAEGGGTFLTLDSALARFAEVPAKFVKEQVYDVFVVEAAPKKS